MPTKTKAAPAPEVEATPKRQPPEPIEVLNPEFALTQYTISALNIECDDAAELERIYNEYTAPGYIVELDDSVPGGAQEDARQLVSDETGFEVTNIEVMPIG